MWCLVWESLPWGIGSQGCSSVFYVLHVQLGLRITAEHLASHLTERASWSYSGFLSTQPKPSLLLPPCPMKQNPHSLYLTHPEGNLGFFFFSWPQKPQRKQALFRLFCPVYISSAGQTVYGEQHNFGSSVLLRTFQIITWIVTKLHVL